ncbi:hypothetical protein Tco_0648216 [Tanacetum coccineum]
MLSLRERMELDLEARLMGETLVLNRSLDPFFEDYIELNDLNVPLELRRDQVYDLMLTIKEDFEILEDMDAYRDEGMGDVIFGEPFLREVGINAKRFKGIITIHNGNEEVTYQMIEGYDLLLWGDLKILFEPNEDDEIWKNQQDYNLISWRLFDSCGIHMLLMHTGIAIHMMIEKKYPLTQEMLSRMLSRRLEVDQESEMAFELLRDLLTRLATYQCAFILDLTMPPHKDTSNDDQPTSFQDQLSALNTKVDALVNSMTNLLQAPPPPPPPPPPPTIPPRLMAYKSGPRKSLFQYSMVPTSSIGFSKSINTLLSILLLHTNTY